MRLNELVRSFSKGEIVIIVAAMVANGLLWWPLRPSAPKPSCFGCDVLLGFAGTWILAVSTFLVLDWYTQFRDSDPLGAWLDVAFRCARTALMASATVALTATIVLVVIVLRFASTAGFFLLEEVIPRLTTTTTRCALRNRATRRRKIHPLMTHRVIRA